MAASDNPVQVEKEHFDRHRAFWEHQWNRVKKRREFLAGDRFEDDQRAYEKDRRLLRIRGQETSDEIRHVVAKVTEKPRSIEARPIDKIDDPDVAEVWVSLVEWALANPYTSFDTVFERTIQACREEAQGIAWMDWDPDEGPFGELKFRWIPADRAMWDPAFWDDPHHPDCTYFREICRMPVDQARQMYNAPWLQPDNARDTRFGPTDSPLLRQGMDRYTPELDDESVTLWKCWYKKDYTETSNDHGDTVTYSKKYQNGRRLVITAPLNKEDQAVYDGDWPIPTARSFPAFFITPYVKPGDSDVDYHWDQQIASDQLRTLANQRVFEHRKYWILPSEGITDAKGKRFRFREDQFNVMYRDTSTPRDLRVEGVDGTGLDPGWQVAFNATQQALMQFRSSADFGTSEERTRDIPVGTTQQLVRQAETPTAHFRRRINRELGKFYGVVADYIQATLTFERAARLRIDGIDQVVNVHGNLLPNYDFVLEDTPEFTGLEQQKADAFNAALQIITNPITAPFFSVWADMNNIPKSVTRRIEKILDEQQQQGPMPGPFGQPPAGPGGPSPLDITQQQNPGIPPGMAA